MAIPASLQKGLILPIISAPMFLVSGPDLVVEACNAGVIGTFPSLNQRTTEGYRDWIHEIKGRLKPEAAAFGVNHIGHFLLTQLLRERLVASAPARVVTVASRAHQWAPGLDWDALRRPTRSLTGIREYMVSKLANVLFSAERQKTKRATNSLVLRPYGSDPSLDLSPGLFDDNYKTTERYTIKVNHDFANSRLTSTTATG